MFIRLINVFYAVFRNLYKNVVQKLNEAEDISMHLKTIIKHFKVRILYRSIMICITNNNIFYILGY